MRTLALGSEISSPNVSNVGDNFETIHRVIDLWVMVQTSRFSPMKKPVVLLKSLAYNVGWESALPRVLPRLQASQAVWSRQFKIWLNVIIMQLSIQLDGSLSHHKAFSCHVCLFARWKFIWHKHATLTRNSDTQAVWHVKHTLIWGWATSVWDV